MKWSLRINIIPSSIRIDSFYYTPKIYDHPVLFIPSSQEIHNKLYELVKGKSDMQIGMWGIEININSNLVSIDFKYLEYITSQDLETRRMGYSMFIQDIINYV